MKRVFLFFLFSLSVISVSSQELEVYEVELPHDSISINLVRYLQAVQEQNMFQLDNLQRSLYTKVDFFSEEQKAVWYYLSGYYFFYLDFYDKAAQRFSKCIQLSEDAELRVLALYARNGMANVEYGHKNLDGAIERFYKIIEESLEEDWALRGKIHANIAPLLFEKSWFFTKNIAKQDSLNDLSDKHYNIAIEILEKNNGWLELSRVYSIYARSLMRDSMLDRAKMYIQRAGELSQHLNSDYRYNFNLIKWSEYYYHLGNYEEALDSSKKALNYFKKVENREMQHYANAVVATYFANDQQYDSAFIYAMNLDRLKRSMGLEQMARQSEQYKIELEVYDKENEILEQGRKLELLALESQISEANQKRWIIGGISAVIIVLLVSLIFIQNVKQKAKVEKTQLIIEEREQAFRSVVEGQEAERKRIAQELHDGIGQQLSGIKMALENMSGSIERQELSFQEQLKKVIQLVGASSSEVRQLAHQMLPQVLEEKGLSEALNDLIQNTYQSTRIKFNYENQLEGIVLGRDWKLTIYRSIQELINNTIKHSEATEIDLYLYQSGSSLLVAFSDNGKGLNEDTLKKGLGLTGIRHRIENLKGSFTIDFSTKKGFNAIFKIPRT